MNRRAFVGGLAAMAAGGLKAEVHAGAKAALRIAHCGDPQLGMGTCGYQEDLKWCERLIEALNRDNLDLVYFTGDMTHLAENVTKDWPRLLKEIRHRVVVSPGNHDVCEPGETTLSGGTVDRFVSVFGHEYESLLVKGWRIVVGNSQYWLPTDETDRKAKYNKWFDATLVAAKAAGEKVIVMTHIPPFVSEFLEPDAWNNCPKARRENLLGQASDAGVRLWLSGHTHTMIHRGWKGIELFNAETTCNNFDVRPFGYRRLVVEPDGTSSWTFCAL